MTDSTNYIYICIAVTRMIDQIILYLHILKRVKINFFFFNSFLFNYQYYLFAQFIFTVWYLYIQPRHIYTSQTKKVDNQNMWQIQCFLKNKKNKKCDVFSYSYNENKIDINIRVDFAKTPIAEYKRIIYIILTQLYTLMETSLNVHHSFY